MARPKKEIQDKQDRRFPTVRCSALELEKLKSLATSANMTLSEFIRTKSLNDKIIVTKPKKTIELSLIYELNAVGKNLNQIAKGFNSTGTLSKSLESVNQKIENVLDRILESSL